uniref:Uncharacterized protein n=1 Tax=Chromera velia CCMP2878 TaxID=1169474 RepID=A0A0G4G320_9ALVE|eukprot:Cvel_20026.t1-p1 / transcript=Cvel_20026.t1 / gene=Cvel_20026 / organism=Chromera_velia_CCMP2878 / gene_product=hypothetical protein / transcript_product=hypothetical protein / location=Cvel_scaffold1768:18728-21245(-) / protein_length=423 / sequence_SO=supercontig / SO=protein_coding / is_pseudo=false
MSSRECFEVERAAISLIRKTFAATEGFEGLEEPSKPLPHFARADLAVRPFGYRKDQWLPVQVKSVTGTRPVVSSSRKPCWSFSNCRGYAGMPIVCISLGKGPGQGESPRAWVFPGDSLHHMKGPLMITAGGKYDTDDSRCSLKADCPRERHVGQVLFSLWEEGKSARGNSKLHTVETLESQQSKTHLAERRMTEKCQQLLETVPGGVDVCFAPCPSLPYDIKIRLRGATQAPWQRVQLKSSVADKLHRNAFVKMRKLVRGQMVPYDESDFDYLMKGLPEPPRAWLFSGDYFEELNLKSKVIHITEGGKHDQKATRCSFDHDSSYGPQIAKRLYRLWKDAQKGIGPCYLQSLDTLQRQQSRHHLAEWTMLQKCRELFKNVEGGVEVDDEEPPCPSFPYDIRIRLDGASMLLVAPLLEIRLLRPF